MAAGTSHVSQALTSAATLADGSQSGPLALAYAGPGNDRFAHVASRMAWWVGVVWCTAMLPAATRDASWALVEMAARPSGMGSYLAALQQLVIAPAIVLLAIALVESRVRPARRVRAVAAGLAVLLVAAGLLPAFARTWLSAGSPVYWIGAWDTADRNQVIYALLKYAELSIGIIVRWMGVLIVLWAIIGVQSLTPRRLLAVSLFVLLLEPATHVTRIVDVFAFPPRPRSASYYLTQPYFMFQHAKASIHLAGAILVMGGMLYPKRRSLLILAAMAIPLGLLIADVPPRIFIWNNLTFSEAANLVFGTLVLASPTLPLLMWRGSGNAA